MTPQVKASLHDFAVSLGSGACWQNWRKAFGHLSSRSTFYVYYGSSPPWYAGTAQPGVELVEPVVKADHAVFNVNPSHESDIGQLRKNSGNTVSVAL
jgi:hypothetical protein